MTVIRNLSTFLQLLLHITFKNTFENHISNISSPMARFANDEAKPIIVKVRMENPVDDYERAFVHN